MDAHALFELQSKGFSPARLNGVLNQMTELVKIQRLCFPSAVVKFCKQYAPDEVVTMWVSAVAGYRSIKSAEADFQSQVLDYVEDISDPDDPDDFPSLFVAAMALELAANRNPIIVTGDRHEQPSRVCLHSACDIIGLRKIDIDGFIDAELILTDAD